MRPGRMVLVHGAGSFGAAAWPRQHGLSLEFDCLYVRRHGFSETEAPLPTDHERDKAIIAEALGAGGHVVAHSQGAVAAMLLAVERPDLVRTLTLVEPACFSLTAELPATKAHIELVAPLFAEREKMSDEQFHREFVRLVLSADAREPTTEAARRSAARLRLQSPPWEAPLTIVPGVPTLVLTGGWEPLYEEVAGYLAGTGAIHHHAPGGHRPQDSDEGDTLIRTFLRSSAQAEVA
ncbi:alpha/beta hydrolase [Arthrobacter echini]|uniref:Alpha/beta hydrolase n=1 Tax=Arthrobacter echini TaxID=1529066 RepID=A0A4S5E601_9MICC|nr:alpha/beta hydrolase [Arthrobacter echini]THJ66951.1 alpha/beta hydrolase [Arthrobacter echini]